MKNTFIFITILGLLTACGSKTTNQKRGNRDGKFRAKTNLVGAESQWENRSTTPKRGFHQCADGRLFEKYGLVGRHERT